MPSRPSRRCAASAQSRAPGAKGGRARR